jgi:hypothetical protein
LAEGESEVVFLPPQGIIKWYDDFLKLLETRKVTKVDKEFLQNQNIASGNEYTLIAALKFLGLVDKDGNAKEALDSLSVVGDKRKENLSKVVRSGYSHLFEDVKLDLEHTDPDTLVNCFKSDYKMGSPTTAGRAARVFVFLAQKADIPLSQKIVDELGVSEDKKRVAKKPKTDKTKVDKTKQESKIEQVKLSEGVLAHFMLKDVGYVDVKDKDTFELAKGYMKLLSKKLGIEEEKIG